MFPVQTKTMRYGRSPSGPGGTTRPRGRGAARVGRGHCGVLVAQGLLDDLAGPGPGPIGPELELLGDLLRHEPGLAAERDHVGQLEPVDPSASCTTAQTRSPRCRVGQPDDGDLDHLGMGVEQVLDLLGADVLPLADDHVLEATGQVQVPVGPEAAQVAGAEVAVLVEGLGVEGGVGVAVEDHRALHPHLAFLVGLRPAGRPASRCARRLPPPASRRCWPAARRCRAASRWRSSAPRSCRTRAPRRVRRFRRAPRSGPRAAWRHRHRT